MLASVALAAALTAVTDVPVATSQRFARTVDWSYVRTGLFPGFGGKFCKVCPNVASDGEKTAFLRYTHLLLTGCDVCYGKYVSKSTDGGVTWSAPKESKALPDTRERGMRTVIDGTPYYSRKHRRWFGLGFKSYFENDAEPMQEYRDGKPYQVPMLLGMDPATGDFTAARELPFPIPYKGCYPFGQIVEEEDGSLLVAFNVTPLEPANAKYRTVTVRYRFEGTDLKPAGTGEQIGDEKLTRGYCEPSLVCAGGKYYLTLRSDEAGCVSVSDDGLRFSAPKPWCWEDGRPIGNRNTQQHWVKLGTKLYLAYTRVTPTNGHVFRNRAPIFLAEVDTEKLCLKRKTERPVTPERGARSGNFCGAPGADGEYWMATAEWMQGLDRSKTTADNTIWLVRFRAEEPAKRRGALCLTFDDSKVENWMKALPLFDKYGARATFFFLGDLGKRELDAMRVMQSYGHSVGLHGALSTHACQFVGKQGSTRYLRKEVLPQLKATYRECLEVENWAYPCSERSEETDKLLLPFFKRLRTGHLFGVIPSGKPLAAYGEAYVPMDDVPKRSVLFGTGFGSDRPGAGAYIAKALERAAERDEALVLYSHDITATPNGDAHDTSLQDLEIILCRAKELGVPAIGFDELP